MKKIIFKTDEPKTCQCQLKDVDLNMPLLIRRKNNTAIIGVITIRFDDMRAQIMSNTDQLSHICGQFYQTRKVAIDKIKALGFSVCFYAAEGFIEVVEDEESPSNNEIIYLDDVDDDEQIFVVKNSKFVGIVKRKNPYSWVISMFGKVFQPISIHYEFPTRTNLLTHLDRKGYEMFTDVEIK